MKLQTKLTNIEMTSEIEEYLGRRVASLEKFVEGKDGVLCEVELGHRVAHKHATDAHYAEFNLSVQGKLFRATGEHEWLHTAIDEAGDDLERQLKKSRKKERTLFRKGSARIKNLLKGFRRQFVTPFKKS